MTPAGAVLLAVQGGIFAVWATVAFRILWRLRARAVAQSGQAMPGMAAQLAEFRAFATAPEDAAARRRIAVLTLALFAMTLAAPAILGAGPR